MKRPHRRQFLHLVAGVAAVPAVSGFARAQVYPTRPVRIIVGFAAGGGADITARLIGQSLSERLGQPFIVENRPGAAGNIGTELVVNAPPDGYTFLLASVPNAATPRSTRSSISISSATSRRSAVSSAFRWSFSCIHRCRPGRSPNLSPMPRPIRAKSTWRPAAPEHQHTWPGS